MARKCIGPLMVDSSISPYLKTYERDIEEVSKADKYRTPIFTNDATAKKYFSIVENGLIEL